MFLIVKSPDTSEQLDIGHLIIFCNKGSQSRGFDIPSIFVSAPLIALISKFGLWASGYTQQSLRYTKIINLKRQTPPPWSVPFRIIAMKMEMLYR